MADAAEPGVETSTKPKATMTEKLVAALERLATENAGLATEIRKVVAALVERETAAAKRAVLVSFLGDVLIASRAFSDEVLAMVDDIYDDLDETRSPKPVTTLDPVPGTEGDESSSFVWLEKKTTATTTTTPAISRWVGAWRGDITTLRCDLVVNAANDEGLGCFVPRHRCVDNVIHRAAGPRLRAECADRMRERPGGFGSLTAGTAPIVTRGYRLPSRFVAHVTGPRLRAGATPTAADKERLQACYEGCLDAAAARNLVSVAFPCVSTGIFHYPSRLACAAAVEAVLNWLDAHPASSVRVVLFDVFADADVKAYREKLRRLAAAGDEASASAKDGGDDTGGGTTKSGVKRPLSSVEDAQGASSPKLVVAERASDARLVATASRWLRDAEAVLVCAGAGASGNAGELVYTEPRDFAHHYPWLADLGYRTSYECMGIMANDAIPDGTKRSYFVQHAENQRYRFAPKPTYAALFEALKATDHFVYTSNVDGNFVRVGFDEARVYAPQGDWAWQQCSVPCRRDSFWPARPELDTMLPHVPLIPDDLVTRCPNCGAKFLPNVRGGAFFTHAPHDAAQDRFLEWIAAIRATGKKLVVLEIGCGYNTPTVTRLPMESIVRDLGDRARLVRVNLKQAEVPRDLARAGRAVGLAGTPWDVGVVDALFSSEAEDDDDRVVVVPQQSAWGPSSADFDWRDALRSLRR